MKTRRFLVIAFFVLAVFLASIRSGTLVYALLYISVLLPVLSILYTLVVYERMKIHQSIESRSTVKNKPVPYVCRIMNETKFVSFTQIELKFHKDLSEITNTKEKQVFTLPAGSTEEIRADVICRRRGRYTIGVEKILISDVLGLFRPSFNPPVEYPVTVYPRVVQLDSLSIFSFEGIRSASSYGSHETMAGDTVHEYVAGDDPRMIHWKASARTGVLQVRQISGVERPRMVIVVDMRKFSEGEAAIVREDNLLEALLAICDYGVSRGIDVDVYAGDNHFFLRDNNDFNELYEWSGTMEFSRTAPPVQVPDVNLTCCAVLSSGQIGDAAAGLINAAEAGAECVLMEFGSGSEVYEAPRLKYICVPDDCDIIEILSK